MKIEINDKLYEMFLYHENEIEKETLDKLFNADPKERYNILLKILDDYEKSLEIKEDEPKVTSDLFDDEDDLEST